MDKTWKRRERQVAAAIGGTRVPITGRQRGDAPDVEHPLFAIEIKTRAKFPGWLHNAMHQAEACATDNSKWPVVILIENGRPITEAFVVTRFSDFKKHSVPESAFD